jgi:hypothetical protein
MQSTLRKLITDPVRERKSIQYKSELNLRIDAAKRNFLASVASFAQFYANRAFPKVRAKTSGRD